MLTMKLADTIITSLTHLRYQYPEHEEQEMTCLTCYYSGQTRMTYLAVRYPSADQQAAGSKALGRYCTVVLYCRSPNKQVNNRLSSSTGTISRPNSIIAFAEAGLALSFIVYV